MTFFLVALPGLEDLVDKETREWFPTFARKIEAGGVTVEAPLAEGLAMNLALKTPTRILLRLESFSCRDFPKLYNKVFTFQWSDYLPPDCTMDVQVSSVRSRVKIKTRIEKTCVEAWQNWQKKRHARAKEEKRVTLFVRLIDDVCTLSLDTSGERLHKRGVRQNIGEAPLRETMAAAMTEMLESQASKPSKVELVDPMMGSGALLLEAGTRNELSEARDFAFQNFRKAEVVEPKLSVERSEFAKLIGYEIDAKTLKAARQNLHKLKDQCEFYEEDFFAAQPLPETAHTHKRWVVCNPPYGERLKVKEPLRDYYAKLFAQVEHVAKPELACFLIPATAVKGKLDLPAAWRVRAKRSLSNGGIRIVAFVFGRA